ncbi:MAG: hypothetical protein HY903_13535 [Deltaproteobacteria bacterium]|nr:hypothetical protein [Deltaproteobacteria bacterium]
MPADIFPIATSPLSTLIRWGQNTNGWQSLVTRADQMEMSGRPAGTKDNGFADTFEGEWLRGQAAMLRMFPDEAALVPFYADATKAVPAAKAIAVAAGDIQPLADPGFTRQGSVLVADIAADLRPLAKRLAETHPGADDGDALALRLSDLDAARPFMTTAELGQVESLRQRYFSWSVNAPAKVNTEIRASADAATGVTVTLRRAKTSQPGTGTTSSGQRVSVTRRIDNDALVIQAPAGARVLVCGSVQDPRYTQATMIYDVPASGALEVRLNDVQNCFMQTYRSHYLPAEQVGILIVRPNETAGLPVVIDKVRLSLPAGSHYL